MPAPIDQGDAKARLRAAKLRVTAPRVAVLCLLARASAPVSHTEVVERLTGEGWDQATLYRNLLKLVEGGLARIVDEGGQARYVFAQGVAEHTHPHFICRDCGAIRCLPTLEFDAHEASPWRHAIARAELQLHGSCPDCERP
ncbi:transcriptional repressor [Myxococcota bacterium]|nr:transcriptional repressor [Myxococcota bacterium]MBU1430855.1 transcriptional repressor [Myxococcota bacterium]MBU1899032.1 transcriptional repressor [Myxococcota bacterium]